MENSSLNEAPAPTPDVNQLYGVNPVYGEDVPPGADEITKREAAEILGLSRPTLNKQIKEGRVTVLPGGKLSRSEIERLRRSGDIVGELHEALARPESLNRENTVLARSLELALRTAESVEAAAASIARPEALEIERARTRAAEVAAARAQREIVGLLAHRTRMEGDAEAAREDCARADSELLQLRVRLLEVDNALEEARAARAAIEAQNSELASAVERNDVELERRAAAIERADTEIEELNARLNRSLGRADALEAMILRSGV